MDLSGDSPDNVEMMLIMEWQGFNDVLSQLTNNAFRSQDWWYLPQRGMVFRRLENAVEWLLPLLTPFILQMTIFAPTVPPKLAD